MNMIRLEDCPGCFECSYAYIILFVLSFIYSLEHHLFLARLHEVQKSYCSHHGRTRSRSTLLKFSRSLYLGNHSSERIHTWTIGTQ